MKPYARVLHLSFAAFFAALHFYLILYIHSSVITERLGVAYITPIFIIGSLLSLIAFFAVPPLLRRFGARVFLALAALGEAFAVLTLAGSTAPVPTLIALLAHLVLFTLLWFTLDIFVEQATSEESRTGSARGLYLTAINIGLVLSPFLMGVIVTRGSFEAVYLTSLVAFAAFAAVMPFLYRSFRDPPYGRVSLKGLRSALSCSDIAPTSLAHLTLRMFYAWAVVYIPLHLSGIGFSWGEIGIMLGIALLPFALFELPVGKLADTFIGEKEIMIAGFLIMGTAVAALSLNLPHSALLYTAILFLTRFGASLIEITTETHFFRGVGAKDIHSMTLFRMLQPLGYVVGVAVGALVLYAVPLESAFLAFGVLVFFGILAALRITDSR